MPDTIAIAASAMPPADHSAPSDEAALVRAVVAGRAEGTAAYETLYRRYAPRLHAVIWRLCGGDAHAAEDVLQDTFIQAWRALPRFRMECALSTWLHRLAVNTALMALRARGQLPPHDADQEALDGLIAPGRCQDTGMDLERAVARLPARARAVLVLHDIEGWKHHEIAEELGVAVGTSKAQLHRARGLLRGWLGERT